MDRYGIPYRNLNKRVFNVGREVCRQFINGSCRYGRSCYYLHEWPAMPSVQICRYFQKGGCWFGDRCRYLHIPHTDGGAAGSRRGSAPVVHSPAWGSRALPDRRGSEPALNQDQGAYALGSSLVTSMTNLQHNLEHLPTDIAEEEEYGVAQAAPRLQQQGGWSQHLNVTGLHQTDSNHSSGTTVNASLASSAVVVQEETVTEMDKQEASPQEGAEHRGAAAAADGWGHNAAYNQSKDVPCGICMDKVYEKASAQERRFGILPNCSHAFCLCCIVTWRKTKDFQEDVIKACPQCRVKSPYYIPSKYWVGEGAPKEALIASFKERSSKIRCSFFMRQGCCPFKSECIYRHELPPGHRPRRRRSTPMQHRVTLEDLDSLQLLNYVIALTLLDDDDDDDDDYYDFLDVDFPLYLEDEYDLF